MGAPEGSAFDAVIDTNAVLALWWFEDPRVGALRSALESRAVRWLLTPRMHAELVFVLDRLSQLRARHGADPDGSAPAAGLLKAALRDLGILVAEPTCTPAQRLWCTDPDDQVFIDLAVCRRARWLITRDRALLRLRRRASRLGVGVCTPEAWPPAT